MIFKNKKQTVAIIEPNKDKLLNIDLNTDENKILNILNVLRHPVFISILIISVIGGGIIFLAYKNRAPVLPIMGEEVAIQNQNHISIGEMHGEYSTNPPTSGWHYGSGTAGAGIKNTPVPDELLIHSLEHGAAIISYKEGMADGDLNRVKEAFNSVEGKKILVPRKDLDTPIAMTSWGRLEKLQTIEVNKIEDFIKANSYHGPENGPI